MSHFTVMVIGFNPEEQLARFSEHIEVPEYCTGEVPEAEKNRMLDYYNGEGGCSFASFDKCYETKGEDWNGNVWRKDYDDVWKEYSTSNPDGKWDWFSLGGRWSGTLKLKTGRKGTKGSSGVYGNVPGIDQAFKMDIDFEGMTQEAYQDGIEHYRSIVVACNGEIPKLLIPAPNRRQNLPADADLKALWDEYREQEAVKIFTSCIPNTFCGPELDDYQCTEEEYAQDSANAVLSTFAYILDGKWHQRIAYVFASEKSGDMTATEWHKHMREMFESLPDDTLISIYDCHS